MTYQELLDQRVWALKRLAEVAAESAEALNSNSMLNMGRAIELLKSHIWDVENLNSMIEGYRPACDGRALCEVSCRLSGLTSRA